MRELARISDCEPNSQAGRQGVESTRPLAAMTGRTAESPPACSESMDEAAMRLALELAREALMSGEIPVGAVVVRDGAVIAQAYNLRETLSDPTAHAERLALSSAGRTKRSWRLDDCTLYATLEPCPMCAGAIVLARVRRVVFGAADRKAGACSSLYRIADDPRLNHRAVIRGGVLADRCSALLAEFFQGRRDYR